VRWEGDLVLTCAGELDLATKSVLHRSLRRALDLAPARIIVDLSRVSFFDAGVIGELVRARRRSRAAGGDLVVRAPSRFGRQVLGSVGLADLVLGDARPGPTWIGASEDVGALDDLVVAWEAACSTDRYGAAPLVFDPSMLIERVLGGLDPSSVTPAADRGTAVVRRDETSAATAVMQLWALRDVLSARSPATGTRSEPDVRRLGAEAALAAMALAGLAELERTTLLDPLTGLLNRRALDRDLLKALAYARRHEQCLSLVMIDVEGLKVTNDQLGHAAGDDTLRGVAASLLAALRAEDNAYRIGGDEFVLVLPALCAGDVDEVMDRTVGGSHGTFTWGCASVQGDADASSDAERAAQLLEQADQRMLAYRAVVRARPQGPRSSEAVLSTAEPTIDLAGRFTAGARSRVVIDEAKGLIAEHFGIDVRAASAMLRAFATAQGQSVQAAAGLLAARAVDVAHLAPHDVLPSTATPPEPDERADSPRPSTRS
jgi:anti-anti-sigma factor